MGATVCPKCGGSGWLIVRKSTALTKNLYKNEIGVDYAEPCPYCNGGAKQKTENVRERANLPVAYYDASIEHFKWDAYTDANGVIDTSKQEKYIKSFIKDFEKWQEKGIGLYIYSKTRGTGKTYLASCICNALMVKYKLTTKFVSASDLIDLAQKKPRQGEIAPIDVMCECKILVLDDLGQKNTGSEWQNDILFKILDSRYQKKLVTLFTSNLKVSELGMDDRLTSRIDKMSQLIPLPESNYRGKEAKDEKRELFKELGLMGGTK